MTRRDHKPLEKRQKKTKTKLKEQGAKRVRNQKRKQSKRREE